MYVRVLSSLYTRSSTGHITVTCWLFLLTLKSHCPCSVDCILHLPPGFWEVPGKGKEGEVAGQRYSVYSLTLLPGLGFSQWSLASIQGHTSYSAAPLPRPRLHWALFRPRGHTSTPWMLASGASLSISSASHLACAPLCRQSIPKVTATHLSSTSSFVQLWHWYAS